MKFLGKVIHGSKLYGLDSPSSDSDFKGLFAPEVKELFCMRAAKNETYKIKESNEEFENFALQKFLQLCSNGEDVCFTMLHAADNKVLVDSDVYKYLRDNKKRFYTKKISGALGYSKSMSVKYSLRADRMNDVIKVIESLKTAKQKGIARIYQMWDDLPSGQYIEKGIDETNRTDDKRYFECVGKKVTSHVGIDYALEIFQSTYDKYGDRVKIANSLQNADYKAISHSFRVGFQLKSIYINGGFEFPLPETEFIKKVKYAELNYIKDNLDEKLNNLITEVESLAAKSNLPEKVNQTWLDDIIMNYYVNSWIIR